MFFFRNLYIERTIGENDVFPFYIEKKQIAGVKNDQAMRKSHGHITWFRALCLIMLKKDPPKLYKIEFATILVEWFFQQLTRENVAFLRNFLRLM
jgi:hypothetical protein